MTVFQLQEVRKWFESYTGTFASGSGAFTPPLQLKVDHSKRVTNNARQLAEDLERKLPGDRRIGQIAQAVRRHIEQNS